MIKKVLVCGKNYYFASKAPESHLDLGAPVEVEMPLEVFWEAEKIIKDIDFLVSSGEPQVEVHTLTRRLIKLCIPYVTLERNRVWLRDKLNDPKA